MEELTLKELSNKLSISAATAKNWLRLGKITPQRIKDNIPYFFDSYVKDLINEIKVKDNNILKSRRNKNYIKGKFFYKDYISSTSQNTKIIESLLQVLENIHLDEKQIKYIIADCAIQLLLQSKNIKSDIGTNFLLNYLENKIDLDFYAPLIDFLVENKEKALQFIKKYPEIFSFKFLYEKNEDVLGLLYISCSNMGKRKQHGMYYTPTKVVKTAIANLTAQNTISADDKVLDCCCGTGNFLLNLPDNIPPEQIYGNDIDSVSCHIAKINLALKYEIKDLQLIDTRISNCNFLTEYKLSDFKYIIGNPPWGYCFSKEQKMELAGKYCTAGKEKIESFDLFIEKSLSILKKDGILAFVLPESVLSVQAHTEIRKIIKEENSIQYLQYLGNIFDGVNCPCIIIQIKHTQKPLETYGTIINTGRNVFEIQTNREVDIDNFGFKTDDKEYEILKKILNPQNKKYLKNNADFALGIVTGDNKKYLQSRKTNLNEVIIKGTDIQPYKIKEGSTFIIYDKANFQQAAPIEKYRTPEKLVYKFISNKLVFAYDDCSRLTLNSCNILIPKIPGMDIKYILAILNSSFAQFVYKKEFNSVKVLRSHIEQIPIPLCDNKSQKEIIRLVNKLIAANDMLIYQNLYDTLENRIRKLYGINSDDYRLIRNSVT